MTRRVGDVDTIWLEPQPTGSRMIEGVASTDRLNSNGTVFESRGLESPALPLPLCINHDDEQVGEIYWLSRSPDEIRIRAAVNRTRAGDKAWAAIEAGELQHLSVGAEYPRGEAVDAHPGAVSLEYPHRRMKRITEWSLREVSLVNCPANIACVFRKYLPPVYLGDR